jgi:hypothetical protein
LFLQQCGNAPPAGPNDFPRRFLLGHHDLAIPDPTSWRLHTRVIVQAFDGDEAPGRPNRSLETLVRLRQANPFEQASLKAYMRQ